MLQRMALNRWSQVTAGVGCLRLAKTGISRRICGADTTCALGRLSRGNVFGAPLSPGQVGVVCNYADGFGLHKRFDAGARRSVLAATRMDSFRVLSWPDDPFLTFVSVDRTRAVRQALSDRVISVATAGVPSPTAIIGETLVRYRRTAVRRREHAGKEFPRG
jgi:hypothetical protein